MQTTTQTPGLPEKKGLPDKKVSVREVFKITQLDKMIEIKDDRISAINSFKKQGSWGFFKK